MPALPETQESIKEEIRRQVGNYLSVFLFIFALAFIHSVENSPKFVTYSNSITVIVLVESIGKSLMIFFPFSCVESCYGFVMHIVVSSMECFAM